MSFRSDADRRMRAALALSTVAPVLLAAILAAGCGGAGESGGGGSTGPAEIVVGHYGSMTGSEATFGHSTSNGINLAIREFNAAGGLKGRKIRLVEYDTQGKTEEAGTAVTRLCTKDKVTAVLGEVASSLSLAGAPVAQENGIPMITPSSTNPRVTKVGDMIFRVCFLDSFQGYAMAKFAVDNLKAKKVATLYDQSSAYSAGLKDDFKAAFSSMGGAIATEQAYNKGDPDFSAQLTNIKATNPDGVFVPGYYTDVGNIALQARKIGLTVPLLGGDGWDSEELPKIAGDKIEGCFYTNHYAPDQPTAEVVEFVAKYKAAFDGHTPDGLAALGYDAAKLLFDAMGRATSLGGKDLAQAIAATKDFKGVTGSITIDANRDAKKSAVVLEMVGGKPTYRATVKPPE
jgi:branched-chain amino acid transport system substrate-binding protein